MAVTPDGAFAYVTNHHSSNVSVIRTSDNTVVGSPIPVGAEPREVEITPDGAFAYVPTRDGVSIINLAHNVEAGRIQVGSVPGGWGSPPPGPSPV